MITQYQREALEPAQPKKTVQGQEEGQKLPTQCQGTQSGGDSQDLLPGYLDIIVEVINDIKKPLRGKPVFRFEFIDFSSGAGERSYAMAP